MPDIKSEPGDEHTPGIIKQEQQFDPSMQDLVPPQVTSMKTPIIFTSKVLLKAENNSSFRSQEATEDIQYMAPIKTEPLCDLNNEVKSEPFIELKTEPNPVVYMSQTTSCASFDCLSQGIGSALLLDNNFPALFDFEVEHMLCKSVLPNMEDKPEIAPASIELPPKTHITQGRTLCSKQPENPVFVEKTEFDIISGRGTRSNIHNQHFRDHMVGPCRGEYRSYSKNQRSLKRAVIDRLMRWVIDRGGRFLELHRVHKKWYEITHKEAVIKLQKMVNEYKFPGEPNAKFKGKKNANKK